MQREDRSHLANGDFGLNRWKHNSGIRVVERELWDLSGCVINGYANTQGFVWCMILNVLQRVSRDKKPKPTSNEHVP